MFRNLHFKFIRLRCSTVDHCQVCCSVWFDFVRSLEFIMWPFKIEMVSRNTDFFFDWLTIFVWRKVFSFLHRTSSFRTVFLLMGNLESDDVGLSCYREVPSTWKKFSFFLYRDVKVVPFSESQLNSCLLVTSDSFNLKDDWSLVATVQEVRLGGYNSVILSDVFCSKSDYFYTRILISLDWRCVSRRQ